MQKQNSKQTDAEESAPSIRVRDLSIRDHTRMCREPWPLEAATPGVQMAGTGTLTYADETDVQEIEFWADLSFECEPDNNRLVFSKSPLRLYTKMVYARCPDGSLNKGLVLPDYNNEDIRIWLLAGLHDFFERRLYGRDIQLLLPCLRTCSYK